MLTKVSAGVLNIDDLYGFRNRIINGAMVIDQRNAGASVSIAAGETPYTLDRFRIGNITDGAVTINQDSSAPAGFVNSLKVTVTTQDSSLSSTQSFNCLHYIEGTNISDLGWGAANAQPVTVSFWVNSSVTGTLGGSLRNSAFNRSYPFSYVINSANTWEYKTVTIAGDTSGTWLTNTEIGIQVNFCLGAGADRSGTAGAWNSNNNTSATGAVSVIGTLGATWQITGVQLEVGSVATPFERRPYGAELALCQRYFYMLCNGSSQSIATGSYYATTLVAATVQLPVEMRTTPSLYQVTGTNYFTIFRNNDNDAFNSFSALVRSSPRCVGLDAEDGNISGTIGHSGPMATLNASARLGFQAEL